MYNTDVFKAGADVLDRGVRGAEAARRQAEQGPRAGLRRPDLHRRRGAVPDDATSRSSASRIPTSSTRTQYKAALDLLREQHPLVQRYWHDANVQVEDFTNEGVVASRSWPFQVNLAAGARSSRSPATVPAEGATGWADTTMMHAERQASELRLHVAGAFDQPEGAGRPRGLVRLGAGGAGGLQGQRAARRRGLRDQRHRQLRQDRVLAHAGRRSARRRRPAACPTTAG